MALSPQLQEKARKELNEKPEWRQRDIDTLRQMILSNKGIKCRTDDEFLLRFLRARKFNYDRSYELLVNYLTIRAKTPQVFEDFNIKAVDKVLNEKIITVLPKRDPEGRRIVYSRIGKWNPDQFSLLEMFKLENLILEYIVAEEETQVNGVVYVADFKGFGMKHAKQMDATKAKLMTTIIQDSFPLRMKASHMVHEPALFSTVHAIIRPFMKEKMASRMRMYGEDHAALHKNLSPDLLPEELGGTLGPANAIAEKWNKDFRASTALFAGLEEQRIELMKDISKKKEDVNDASVTGTFRKLNVD